MITFINFFLIVFICLFVGTDSKLKNFLYSLLISLFFILEGVSFAYIGRSIGEDFIFFASNLNLFNLAKSTTILFVYYILVFFAIFFAVIYLVLNKIHIKKFRKTVLLICFIFFITPYGFIYKIIHTFVVDYAISYYEFKDYSYQDIYMQAHNTEYITKDKLEILNSKGRHKNLVLIYLESFEQKLLTEDKIKPYTKNINELVEKGEYYKNIEQLPVTNGTLPGIISSQCGIQYIAYFLFSNPYNEIHKNSKLVCLSDVLNKSGYEQVFIGGANKQIVNKGNFLLSHNYDSVEDKSSLLKKYPKFAASLVEWGVSDFDVFEAAKDRYKELSKSKKPFNLTILTTATHNPYGEYDKRCPNTANKKLLNAIECTDFLVNDFINFLKRQKNFKDTLIVLMPDHKQYERNEIADILGSYDERKLFTIILNSGIVESYDNSIYYTDIAEILLNKLNVKSNANFLKKQDNLRKTKNFIHKIHRD